MKPVLLLVDLQRDYLANPRLEPAASAIVEQSATLLQACREQQIPVMHIWTTVDADPDTRMPHWQRLGKWLCVRGSEGHRPPAELQCVNPEMVVHKRYFNAFAPPELDASLRKLGIDTVIIAGVHLHACVRATALEAYERGHRVWIADDAVGSDDPIHAAITRRYLAERSVEFLPVAQILARRRATSIAAKAKSFETQKFLERRSPANFEVMLEPVPIAAAAEVDLAVRAARQAIKDWSDQPATARGVFLNQLADRIAKEDGWADEISRETGKPIRYAREEVFASVAQLRAIAQRAGENSVWKLASAKPHTRRCPLGSIGVITSWNNPLFLPLGKVAAALMYGNTVVWKPSPAGSSVARRLQQEFASIGLPTGIVGIVLGDRSTAEAVMGHPGIDGVSITGSLSAGYSAQEICARRHVPLQAELGGNNAAIVWSDADLSIAAKAIAEGAFAMAGQRCTANRRAVVDQNCLDRFLKLLIEATGALVLGDPANPQTQIGPMIARTERDRVESIARRARSRNLPLIEPFNKANFQSLLEQGSYAPPKLIVCEDPADELVQTETFGPLLVIQPAKSWTEAIAHCNGVRQGLVAALFSTSPERQADFLSQARAGILKINRATAGADVDMPFGGWKASGIGPAEHGESDREFYARIQTIYP